MKVILLAVMLNASGADTRIKWLPVVKAAATHYNIDWHLVDSVIYVESRWDPKATSKAGAMGLGQLMPGTAKELRVRNAYDPGQNIWGTAWYLSRMNNRFCDWELALAAYNAGPHKVKKHNGIPPYKETKKYIKRVLRRWDSIEVDLFSSNCRR